MTFSTRKDNLENYKFILAFESQLCTDFVSNTIFNVSEEETVAVVMEC